VIDEKHVMSLKVVGLKELCTKFKLSSKGKKAVLQDRILEHLQLGKYTVGSETSENSELETGQSTVEARELQENGISSIEESKESKEMMIAEPEKKISSIETTVSTSVSDDVNLNQQISSASDAGSNDVSKAREGNVNDVMKEKPPTKEGNQLSEQDLSVIEETTIADVDIGIISEEVAVSNKAELKIECPMEKPVIKDSDVEKPIGTKRKSSEAIISLEDISNKKRKTCEAVEPDLRLNYENVGDGLEAVEDQAEEVQVHTTVVAETEMDAEAEVQPEVLEHAEAEVQEAEVQSEAVKHAEAEVQVAEAEVRVAEAELQSEVVEHAEAEEQETKGQDELEGEFKAQLPADEKIESKLSIEEQLEKSADQDVMEDQAMNNLIAQSALKVQHHEEKITQPSKPIENKNEGRKIKSQENYHRRDHGKQHQSMRNHNRRRYRNRGNWNRNRNRNWNGGYQQGNQPSQRWLFRQDNWRGNSQHVMNSMPVSQQRRQSGNSQHLINSMPVSQQQRHWNPAEGWQQQRSYYQGGYGNFSGRSGRGRGWRRGGGWQDRRNGRWRDNRSGMRGRR